jgi:DNA-binding FadR family transcriptional regulator
VKVAHRVAGELRRRIVRGELRPEQPLPSEADLLATFKVSKETLREALGVLESESLIRIKRGRAGGAFVRQPDLQAAARYVSLLLQVRGTTLLDLQETRRLLECPAASMLAEQPPFGALEGLRRLHVSQRRVHRTPLHFVAAVTEFDQAVAALSGNHTLATVSGVFREAYAGALYSACLMAGSDTELADATAEHHRRYLEAVIKGDGGLAGDAWSEYLSESTRLIRRLDPHPAPIDVVPLWRARASDSPGSGAHSGRMARSVAAEIRARLALGELNEGDRLAALPELAQEFAVSRPTLREALRVLENEGLLSLRAGSRSGPLMLAPASNIAATLAGIVLESEHTTLGDVWEARLLIEPPAMGLSAERIDAEDLEDLRRIRDETTALVSDTEAFARQSIGLRFGALNAARNPALAVAFEIVRWVASGSVGTVAATAAGLPWEIRNNRRVATAYNELVDRFVAGDGPGAAKVWYDHLMATAPALLSSLGSRFIVDLVDY